MSDYNAPLKDMQFVLTELAGMAQVSALPGYAEATPDLIEAILEESGKFSRDVLAPLNFTGDQEGAQWADKAVTMPKGFKEAYAQFVDNGWNAVSGNPEFGGQGLPEIVSAAVGEIWNASNVSFGLCPLLTQGAIHAIEAGKTEEGWPCTAVRIDLVTGAITQQRSLGRVRGMTASFSPDGARVVTASKDQSAKVWDAKTGAEILTLKRHTGAVASAAFSADGLRVVTGSLYFSSRRSE